MENQVVVDNNPKVESESTLQIIWNRVSRNKRFLVITAIGIAAVISVGLGALVALVPKMVGLILWLANGWIISEVLLAQKNLIFISLDLVLAVLFIVQFIAAVLRDEKNKLECEITAHGVGGIVFISLLAAGIWQRVLG